MLFRILTIAAVAALAISSWILSTPGRTPGLSSAAGHAARPGYYLKNAVLTDHDAEGQPSIRITAQRIDQIARTTAVALYDVRVDYQAPGGQAWILFGDNAHVEPGGKAVDLTGNVRLQGPDEGRGAAALIRTDALTYDVSDSVASTQDDVRIDFEEHVVTARGLIANLKERTVRLESRVNGRFHP